MKNDSLPVDDDSMPHLTVDDMRDLECVLKRLTAGLIGFAIVSLIVAFCLGRRIL